MKRRISRTIVSVLFALSLVIAPIQSSYDAGQNVVQAASYQKSYSKSTYGTFSGNAYKKVHGNKPYFSKKQKKSKKAFEKYSKLDRYGRCGVAFANVCKAIMPTTTRGEIGSVRPSGWHTVKYPGVVPGNYLYNRCHLIGYQLAGENANPKNLITGTRYLNMDGMLPFENEIDDYVESTGHHVLYRVTPIYKGSELVARGVLMEGYSVEDKGKGIQFCVFAYNAQPGVKINYKTGNSSLTSKKTSAKASKKADTSGKAKYILSLSTKKYHRPSCRYVSSIAIKNRKSVKWTKAKLKSRGYVPCKVCCP